MKGKRLILLGMLLLSASLPASAAGLFKSGDKIAFLGDSITAQGNNPADIAYNNVIREMLGAVGVEITVIPAGVSGDTSKGMLARMPEQVVARKPDWMFLMCGVNDIWLVGLHDYKKNIEAMHQLCRNNNIKMFLLTPTVPRDNGQFAEKIEDYVKFVREYARANQIPMADMYAWSQREMKKYEGVEGNSWTQDGIHPTALSHIGMAQEILTASGYDASRMQGAADEMLKRPEAVQVSAQFNVSCSFYQKLLEGADKERCAPNQVFEEMCRKAIVRQGGSRE